MLGCLREQVEDLGAACKEEVFRRQAEAANDWRTDKELRTACEVRQVFLPLNRLYWRGEERRGAARPFEHCPTPCKESKNLWAAATHVSISPSR